MKGPTSYIIQKEFLEIKRSHLFKLLIIAPIMQMIVFGFVAITDVKNLKLLVCDHDNTSLSRQLAESFLNNEDFILAGYTHNENDIDDYLNYNKAKLVLNIPPDFSRNIRKGKPAKVQIIVDGSDSNAGLMGLNRALAYVQAFSARAYEKSYERARNLIGPLPEISMEERIWYNEELKSADSMVPGVVGLILAIVTIIVTAVSLVREKESGNIEQVLVTPVKSWQIITGKVLPYVLIAFLDIILITGLSILIFNISFRGSFLLLIALSVFMILANLGLGIFISTVSRTQQQAMLSAIFIMMPSILLSGFIFAIKNMPPVMQWITYLIPMRYYMVIIKGIFLKGLTFPELYDQVLALFIFSVIIFSLAIIRFKKKLN